MSPRRLWLPGIQVHIVTPMAPPPSNVKNPSEVGLSSSSMILGIKLIHPSSAPVSRAMHATICVSSSMLNFTRSICRSSRATRGVSQLAALHSAGPPMSWSNRPARGDKDWQVLVSACRQTGRLLQAKARLLIRCGASRPVSQFPGVRSPEPDRALDGTGHYERAGKITVFGRRPLCERRSPFLVRCLTCRRRPRSRTDQTVREFLFARSQDRQRSSRSFRMRPI